MGLDTENLSPGDLGIDTGAVPVDAPPVDPDVPAIMMDSDDDNDLETMDSPENPHAKLEEELTIEGAMLLNLRTNAVVTEVESAKTVEEKNRIIADPKKKALWDRHIISTRTTPIDLDPRSDPEARYVHTDADGNEKGLSGIIEIRGDTFICSVHGSTTGETVQVERSAMLTLMLKRDTTEIGGNFSGNEQQIVTKYIQLIGKSELPPDFHEGLPTLITEVAETHSITTTDTLIRAGETYYKAQEIPTGATPEEIAQITAENQQKADLLDDLEQKLDGKNLATTEDKKNVMSLIGLDKKGITATLEQARAGISTLRKMIDQASTPEAKKQLQARLDTAQATAKIYEEVQSKITDTTVDDFEASQQAGGGSADLRKQINQAIEENDIVALVLMASPEASVTATAAEITKAREAREKYNKNLKTIGVVAALTALLLALGISQGAKQ